MRLTGAVKVLFGCVVGLEKAQFHVKVPDRMDFAHMLLDILSAVQPRLSIVDAVLAIESDGPSGGSPRHVGALIAGADHVAVDVVASRLVAMDPMSIYVIRAAAARGLLTGPDSVDIVGGAARSARRRRLQAAAARCRRVHVWTGRAGAQAIPHGEALP